MDFHHIKICIFDVNGVLIDSNSANAHAMGRAFTDDPLLQEHIADLYLKLTGIDRGEKIRQVQKRIIQRPFKKNEFVQLWEKLKILTRISMGTAPLTPHCKDILKALKQRGICRIALSNTPLDELRPILVKQTLDSFLDIIRGGGDWPKIESLRRLLDEFGFSPGACLFVGDGKGDLWAARSAGIFFVAIDPDTGEFDHENGFAGPFQHLAQWAWEVGLLPRHPDKDDPAFIETGERR